MWDQDLFLGKVTITGQAQGISISLHQRFGNHSLVGAGPSSVHYIGTHDNEAPFISLFRGWGWSSWTGHRFSGKTPYFELFLIMLHLPSLLQWWYQEGSLLAYSALCHLRSLPCCDISCAKGNFLTSLFVWSSRRWSGPAQSCMKWWEPKETRCHWKPDTNTA